MRTILIALFANIVIAIAKLISGLVSGSTGMLAEAAHSAADAVNEIFLAVGLHRDRQPADRLQASSRPWPRAIPLGVHGCNRFIFTWRLLVYRDGHCRD